MKKIFILSLLVIIGVLAVSQVVLADSAMISASPASASNTVGTPFNVSVQLDPGNNNVCVVKGTINLDKLACQSITLGNGIMGQTIPTCDAPNFTLGIPKCTTASQNLLSISVKGTQAGQASLVFTGVKVIGAGKDVSFGSQSGAYEITAVAPQTVIPTPAPKSSTTTKSAGQKTTQLVATTSTSTEEISTTTQETGSNNVPTNTGAVGWVILTSGYTWSLIIILLVACIAYGIYYLVKKNKNE